MEPKEVTSASEAERVAALERYGMLDTPPDALFDSIAQAAADLCETPIALISLIDPTRQWFKSCVGMDLRETSRDIAFCAHAIGGRDFMEIEDTLLDERFCDNPMVTGEPNIRFYAGQPLVTVEGFALGTLCVIDRQPRTLNEPQRHALRSLADAIMAVFEERRVSIARQRLAEERIAGFGDVLEASINEIFMFDESSLRFVHVNHGARDNLGYSMEELRELTPIDIKPEFTLETFEAKIKPLRNNEKEKIDFITMHQRKDGSSYPVEVHLQRSHFGSTPVFAAIILDITERIQTEQALRESHDLLEQRVVTRTVELAEQKDFSDKLIATLQGIVLLLDKTGRISLWNPYLEALTGYRAAEVIGLDWFDTFIPEGERASIRAFFQRVMREAFNKGYTNAIVTKSGEHRLIEWHSKTLDGADGEIVGMLCTGYDVTARAAAAVVLEKTKEEAERATAIKSRFLAAASHDLRQPLQSIGLYLSVLDRQFEKQRDKEISNKIRNSLDVMGELLDALLDISQLDSGSVTPTKKDFPIQTLLDQLVAASGPQATAKGLAFRCERSPCVLHTDPALLQRIIENFVSNAIRYTDTGSIEVRCEAQGEFARIEVKDSGAGIPEESLDTIFEEYFQLDNPVRDRRKGLGLGLSIVKHIARLLDLRLEVTSAPGEGSTFSVQVPLGQAIERSIETSAPASTRSLGGREPVVLLVDDDPAIIDATAMLLGVSGFDVHSALSGDEALAHLANGIRPDVVVSDYRLPGFTGVEVIRRVRKATSNDLPTVLMTGDTSAQEIEAAKLDHCTVLHKPVDTDQLVAIISDLAASR